MTRQQGLVAALLLSLGVNLLIAGAFLGHALDERRRPPPPLAWAARELPDELRRDIRAYMRSQLPRARPLRQELRAATRALAQIAEAQPLDRAALEQALARERQARDAYQAFMHARLLDVVEKLPPEQRLALLREALQRRPGRGAPPFDGKPRLQR